MEGLLSTGPTPFSFYKLSIFHAGLRQIVIFTLPPLYWDIHRKHHNDVDTMRTTKSYFDKDVTVPFISFLIYEPTQLSRPNETESIHLYEYI